MLPRLSFRLPLDPARMRRARDRIRDYLHEQRCSSEAIDEVVLAIEEAMTNAVRHSGAQEDLEVDLRFEGTDLIAGVKDRGRGFDTSRLDLDQIPNPCSPGGRGLFLMARAMDDLAICCDGGVEIRAVKRDALALPHSERAEARSNVPGEAAYGDTRRAAMLDEIDEGFMALDWEYRFLDVNTTFERLFRLRRQDLVGHILWEFENHPGGLAGAQACREAMELGKASVLEYEWPTTGFWVEARNYPTSSGIVAYARDISERKRRELERRRALRSAARKPDDARALPGARASRQLGARPS